ncbi:MAG: serine/threonine-protein phosphatase [Anaerolineae bacterium]|nr:serine/threonine-protein phosphatase [Anaerolineae bacterium]
MNFLRRLLGRDLQRATTETDDEAEKTAASAESTDPMPAMVDVQSTIETAPLAPRPDAVSGTRRLAEIEEIQAFDRSFLAFGYALDVGTTRDINQDALVAQVMSLRTGAREMDFGLFGIADGMGGHQHGERASTIATSTLTERMIGDIYLPLLGEADLASNEQAQAEQVRAKMLAAFQEANRIVMEQVPGGGTTATFAVTIGNAVYVTHIGDSRAYLITGQGIEQITSDHSLAHRLFIAGQLTREEMRTFQRRNELYKVMGSQEMEPDFNTRRLPPGAHLLLCSDGLWGEVPEVVIQDVVITAYSPHAACARLVQLANERGGRDNISAVAVRIPAG